MSQQYFVLRSDDVEPFMHPDAEGYHSQHVLGEQNTGIHDCLLNCGTVEAHHSLAGTNHPDNDEIYYATEGACLVDLGGHPDTGEGCKTYPFEKGMVAFIPAGTFHRLRNDTDGEFRLLTIWPQPAALGANGVHDLRLETWGTGFRLREGRELVGGGEGGRVVERATD